MEYTSFIKLVLFCAVIVSNKLVQGWYFLSFHTHFIFTFLMIDNSQIMIDVNNV